MVIHWTDKSEPTRPEHFDDAVRLVTQRFPKSKAGDTHQFIPGISRCVFSEDDLPIAELFWENQISPEKSS